MNFWRSVRFANIGSIILTSIIFTCNSFRWLTITVTGPISREEAFLILTMMFFALFWLPLFVIHLICKMAISRHNRWDLNNLPLR